MNASVKTRPSKEVRVLLETLKKAVAGALEKKKRLGQYAVIWQEGRPVMIGEDAPDASKDQRRD